MEENVTPTPVDETMAPTPETEMSNKDVEPPPPAGLLFDSIGYHKTEDIPKFIEEMKVNDAAMVLLSATAYAHKKGILTLIESEVASKAIRVFTAPRMPQGIPVEAPPPPEAKIEQPNS